MPSNEAGFYQLTALLPIKAGPYTSLNPGESTGVHGDNPQSYAHHLKACLNQLSDSFLENITEHDQSQDNSLPTFQMFREKKNKVESELKYHYR